MTALEDVNTLEQAADYLKITEPALKSLVSGQKIGSLKQGRALTFPRAVIEAYVAAHTTQPLPPNAFGLTNASARRIRGRVA